MENLLNKVTKIIKIHVLPEPRKYLDYIRSMKRVRGIEIYIFY